MAGTVSHKLSNSFEGALAGGGDPATSPLYVFGPFLRLVIVAGVAGVTFGATVWLVVFTIAMVSAMYRLVMLWVTDGSGGSGLSEEEFGGWAVKINAAITFIEYTLTFLVSMAAMVTFVADRFAPLNDIVFLGVQYRTLLAIVLSLLTGWLVNRGPKMAARAFGPATAAVLALLWVMVIATIWKHGFHLPSIDFRAFTGEYLHFTLGGFTRMLAVMTGIEVFANLVAAYDGGEKRKSNKAFGSLLIIMGTTAVTMLVVGPAIRDLSNPMDEQVSVFTQTMDALLPEPLPYVGTLIGIAVLLSASAASAQGLQNLALGLKDRRYIPAFMGTRNQYEVADKPVWLEVGLVTVIFLFAGTNEETYLAIYAAGVFVLLSMTGWAVVKRLIRELRMEFDITHLLILIGTVLAASITSAATLVIFEERFTEGAWTYFIFVPALYAAFSYFRNRLGSPSQDVERLGGLEGAMLGGFGMGQSYEAELMPRTLESAVFIPDTSPIQPRPEPVILKQTLGASIAPRHILVPLDGSANAEQSLPVAEALCKGFNSRMTLVSVLYANGKQPTEAAKVEKEAYLKDVRQQLEARQLNVSYSLRTGHIAESIHNAVGEHNADLVVISVKNPKGKKELSGSIANSVIRMIDQPVLIVHPNGEMEMSTEPFKKLLVTLDGSKFAEKVLPYARAWASLYDEVLLLRVPHIPEAQLFGAAVDEIADMRDEVVEQAREYLEGIAESLREDGIETRVIVTGSDPAQTILSVAEDEQANIITLATHGRHGLERLFIGSVAEKIVQHAQCPVLLVPAHEKHTVK